MLSASQETREILSRKDREIKSKVEVYNTAFAVPTKGIQFKLYYTDDIGLNPSWTQIYPVSASESGALSNLSLYWGQSAPFNINIDRYKLICSGYFYIEENADNVNFEFIGDGNLSFDFNYNSILISGQSSLSINKDAGGFYYSEAIDISGAQGDWKPFIINFDGKTNKNYYGGFAVRYRFDNNYSKILNAGIVNDTPEFISPYTIEAISIEGSHSKGQTSVYNFSVPLTDATHAKGFYYDNTNEYYLDSSGNILKEGQLLSIKAGYKVDNDPGNYTIGTYESEYELLPRFKGFINSINKDRDSEKLNIECFGFDEIPNSDVIKNYPNPSSYWNFGYFNQFTAKEPDGINMPIAYDKWNLVHAVEDLFIKSGLPASLLYGTKYFQNSGYALKSDNAVIDFGYQLDWNIDYGTGEIQNEYLYGSQFGDRILDTTISMIDAYGMFARFNNEGNFEIRSSNNPVYTYSDKSVAQNMIADPDFSLDKNTLVGSASKNTFHYNFGSASLLVTGYAGAVFNPINLYYKHKYYLTFYVKHLVGTNEQLFGQYVQAGTPFLKYPNPFATTMVAKRVSDDLNYIPKLENWTRYYIEYNPRLNFEGYQFYLKNNSPDTTALFVTDFQLETGAIDDYVKSSFEIDFNAIGGTYLYLLASGDTTYKYFQGSGLSLVMKRSPYAGPADNNNDALSGTPVLRIDVEEYNRGEDKALIYTGNFQSFYVNPYYSSERHYLDGIDDNTGDNPCIVQIDDRLFADYSDYKIRITKIVSGYPVYIDAIWLYDEKKDYSLYTIDSTIDVSNLSYQSDLRNQRNDVLVAGQRKGVWVGGREEELSWLDENRTKNNVYTNYFSRAIDLDSIYNPNSNRWIGRNSSIYIQEPNINNDERAEWLSVNVLSSLKNKNIKPNFSIIANPILEIGDCITVEDAKNHSVKCWIQSLQESITPNDWKIEADVTGIEPWPSFQRFEDYDPSDFGDNAIINITVIDTDGFIRRGDETALSGSLSNINEGDEDTINVDSASDFPNSGILVIHDSDSALYGKFEYTSKGATSFTGTWVFLNISENASFPDDAVVTNNYNPYEVDDCGTYMKITFDCIIGGKLMVGVKKDGTDSGSQRWISGLTKGGGIEDYNPKWIRVASGDSMELIWGGIDETGYSHPEKIDGEKNPLYEVQNYFTHDDTYYFQLKFISDETEKPYTYCSNALKEDFQNSTSEVVKIKRSLVDDLVFSFVHSNENRINNYFIPGNGSISINGIGSITGYNNGSYARNMGGDWHEDHPNDPGWIVNKETRNYLYFPEEGALRFNVSHSNIDNKRGYIIDISANIYEIMGLPVYISTGKSEIRTIAQKIITLCDKARFDENGLTYFDSNDKNIVIDISQGKYGAYSFTSEINNIRRRVENGNESRGLRTYCLIIKMDIRDKSGRRVVYVSSKGYSGDEITNNYQRMFYNENDFIIAELWLFPKSCVLYPVSEPNYPPWPYVAEVWDTSNTTWHLSFEPDTDYPQDSTHWYLPFPMFEVSRNWP